MTLEAYKRALAAAQAETKEIRKQMVDLEKRSAQLRETVATLRRLIDEESPVPPDFTLGLTDAVREVMKASDRSLTPVQVRDGLIRIGVDPDGYSNLLASVHNILKRLVKSGEVAEGYAVDRTGDHIKFPAKVKGIKREQRYYRWYTEEERELIEKWEKESAKKRGKKK